MMIRILLPPCLQVSLASTFTCLAVPGHLCLSSCLTSWPCPHGVFAKRAPLVDDTRRDSAQEDSPCIRSVGLHGIALAIPAHSVSDTIYTVSRVFHITCPSATACTAAAASQATVEPHPPSAALPSAAIMSWRPRLPQHTACIAPTRWSGNRTLGKAGQLSGISPTSTRGWPSDEGQAR
jgi:hypothetical protein